jgi:hypothetical protein
VPPSPGGRRGATSYGLMGPRPPVQALLLNISVKEPWRSHNGSEAKVIFLLDSAARFSVLPFSPGPWSNDTVIVWGIFGQALE